MNIDELIATLMRLSEESPRRSATEVLLRNEGDMKIEGASLGRAQLPHGRSRRSPVVIIQAGTAHRSPMRRVPGRTDRSDEDAEDPTGQDVHAEATRFRLCRAIAKRLDELEAATGEWSRPLEHLLRVIETDDQRGKDSDTGQLCLFDDRPEEDFARAEAICEATGAVVIHSGSEAVYQYQRDKITMPARSRYRNVAAYYTTRFHLTAHWAEKRLGWEGDAAHAKLVAVLVSYLLADAAGIRIADFGTYREFHSKWLQEIRSDAGFLVRMLAQAHEVAKFILSFGGGSGAGDGEPTR